MTRYALVIGIANYNNFTQQLPKAVTDAQSIAQVLREHGRFEVQPLPGKLIKSENRWCVAPDKKLPGKELGLTLRKFLLEKAKNHEALIYFAGHGFEAPTLTGKQKGYLATSDCTSDGQNAIAFDDFNDLIRESQLASLVVLLDCCYAGSFLEKSFLRSSLPVFNTKQDYRLITASRDFERAREDIEGGIFTQAVLRGLSYDNADERTGEVNASGLFSFISHELKHSGQEAIYMGGGRSITLVCYESKKPVVSAVVRDECPYRGLEAFEKQHEQFFFGRKLVVEEILKKLAQAQFVPIIGASGSGKSSVVRAGLIPQLENNGWQVLEPIKPGIEPLAKLRATFEPFFQRREIQQLYDLIHSHQDGLHRVLERLPGSERLLLVVDQFEEVFTLCPQEEERRKFIELLTNCSVGERLAIVTTMRADFLEPCLHYPSLTQLIQNQAVYMPPLVGAELEQAIASGANRQGYCFEDGLRGEIMQDVGTEQGCLALLQFALTELWKERDRQKHQLTVEKYKVIGGVIGALNQHAENIYHNFTQKQQEWVKQIFLKLVRTHEGDKDTRQRQPKAKMLAIGGENEISFVLDELIQQRLLVTGQEEQQGEAWVDLAHEALMEGWQRFADWRQENWEVRRLIDRVEDALREWQKNPQNENLMMGGLLAEVREKWLQVEPHLYTVEREFYQHSNSFEQDRIATLERAVTNSAKSEIQALCEFSAALFASNQKLDALREAIRARRKLQKLGSVDADTQNNVELVLRRAVYGAVEYNCLEGHSGEVQSAVFSPDGKTLASTSNDKTVRLWKRDGRLLATLEGHHAGVLDVAISPDGQTIASASEDNTIKLWKRDGTLLATLEGHNAAVSKVAFSPQGNTLASASDDWTVKLWKVSHDQMPVLLTTLNKHENSVKAVAFSPDGNTIASASADKTVKLWKGDGTFLTTLAGHNDTVWDVAFSPDGNTIASASGTVKLWNRSGNLLKTLEGASVAFSSDGNTIASGSWDNTVKLWNKDGTLLTTLNGHSDRVWGVTFSPDSKILASVSGDKTIKFWKLDSALLTTLRGHSAAVIGVAISPNGKMVASASDDGTVKLWTQDSTLPVTLDHKAAVYGVAFSPDSRMIVSVGLDSTVKLWNKDGSLLNTLKGHKAANWGVAFSPDGNTIASASADKTVKLWNFNGTELTTLKGHQEPIWDVAISPDGNTIASASGDMTVKLWKRDGTELTTLKGHKAGIWGVAFSPNGNTIASASEDMTVKLWKPNGTLLTTLEGHQSIVFGVAFSPDGKILASASADKTVKLWKVEAGKLPVLLTTLNGHSGRVWGVAFSSDGKTLASASDDKTVILWKLDQVVDLDKVMAYGCNWVRDYLKTNRNVNESDRTLYKLLTESP
nr:caspase family protein [Nostoc sp. ChiQUE02]MDZ8228805.1 caspase family protein [Nostoc sp. ChiQUE02]